MTWHVILFADARPGTGYGHLYRILPIYRRLQAEGIEAQLWTPLDTATLTQLGLTDVSSTMGQPLLADHLLSKGIPDWLILDTYESPNEIIAMAQSYGTKTAVVDDHQRITEPVELLINCSPGATRQSYPSQSAASLLLGPSYMPLDEPFQMAQKAYEVRPDITNVLVSLGGQDTKNNLPVLLTALDKDSDGNTLFHFMGSNLPTNEHTSSRLRNLGWVPYHEMADTLLGFDLAIISGGTMLHQCCSIGLPSLCIPQVDNQRRHAMIWQARGATVVSTGPHSCIEDILAYRSQKKRQLLSEAGSKLVDGLGAVRILEAMRNRQ